MGWTGKTDGDAFGAIWQAGTCATPGGKERGDIEERQVPFGKNMPLGFISGDNDASHKLTPDQRDMIRKTMGQKRNLKDAAIQLAVLRRVEGALTYLDDAAPINARAADHADALARALKRAQAAIDDVPGDVRDMLDAYSPGFASALAELNAGAGKVADGLKFGRGENPGTDEGNRARFIAAQIADVFCVHGIPRGCKETSAFHAIVNVTLGQLKLPALGESALKGIAKGGGK